MKKVKTTDLKDFKEFNAIRNASGNVQSEDPLVCFFYLLVRDYLPAGEVEKIVEMSDRKENSLYTNGWIANYAKYIVERLTCTK